jgi:diadenosine tetraphosphate (Ap4A) HIT family hydrolase
MIRNTKKQETDMSTSKPYRSIDPAYVHQIIREYEHWTLSIHEDQRYLGRCYAWLVREGEMQRFSQLSADELRELHAICKQLEAAWELLWKPDHVNYCMLGNYVHLHAGHGHMHLIPRYKEPREFNGRTYTDDRWGKNYAPATRYVPEATELLAIRDAIKDALDQ